jgi:hypothetical protein
VKLAYEKNHRAKPGTTEAWCGAALSPVDTVRMADTPTEDLTCYTCVLVFNTESLTMPMKKYAEMDAEIAAKQIGIYSGNLNLTLSDSYQAASKLIMHTPASNKITFYSGGTNSMYEKELYDHLFKKMFP